MNSKRAIAQLLKHLTRAGVTHLPKVSLLKPSRIAPATRPAAVAEVETRAASAESTTGKPRAVLKSATEAVSRNANKPRGTMLSAAELQVAGHQPDSLAEVQAIMSQTFISAEQKKDALCALAKQVQQCRRCADLASKRTQTVFGVGNPAAEIMFIGEAPGAEEDASGVPFVGPAGQLLNKIIEASRLRRDDLYICNILRCRPPGNRNPQPQEAANCREFLDAQIHVVQPKYIICWGTVAAQNLLKRSEAVGKLRGQFFDYRGIKVMCTYHPSYLLRNPAAKKQVWDDMKFFMQHLGVELQ